MRRAADDKVLGPSFGAERLQGLWGCKRWRVEATYRAEGGPVVVVHEVEELDELREWVEQGPTWHALVDIRITWQRNARPEDLTAGFAALLRAATAQGGGTC